MTLAKTSLLENRSAKLFSKFIRVVAFENNPRCKKKLKGDDKKHQSCFSYVAVLIISFLSMFWKSVTEYIISKAFRPVLKMTVKESVKEFVFSYRL